MKKLVNSQGLNGISRTACKQEGMLSSSERNYFQSKILSKWKMSQEFHLKSLREWKWNHSLWDSADNYIPIVIII